MANRGEHLLKLKTVLEPNWLPYTHLKHVLARHRTFTWNERARVTALATPIDDLTGELHASEIISDEQLESKRLQIKWGASSVPSTLRNPVRCTLA
jgi:hypothetical protein